MSDSYQAAYEKRIHRVIDYIEAHLDGDLSVERLSVVAGFSKFHFHRQFSAHTGTTVAKLTRRLRLKQAAWKLAFSEKKVIEIALEAGFTNPESFARAFKAEQSQTPSEFRVDPQWKDWNLLRDARKNQEQEVNLEIVDFPTTKIASLTHRGAPHLVMNTVGRFIEWRKKSHASPEPKTKTFGIVYDDPDRVKPENFRFDVCSELLGPVEDNEIGVTEQEIPGGRCATAVHHGTLDTLGEAVRSIYCDWVPKSGEELRDFPCFFHYKKRMPQVAEHEQETIIYLPLK